jgi:hypothetical protein
MQRFESLLLAPVIILGTPVEAGLNQKNSTSLTLGTQTAFDFDAPLQQASLSQNAQWHSQKPFKPLLNFVNYLWDTPLAGWRNGCKLFNHVRDTTRG